MTADAYLVIRCEATDETSNGVDGDCVAEASWPIRFEPHNHTELRRLIKEQRGWDRQRRDGRLVDLCPEHAAGPA
ncbi:MAG: hypothetical protein K0R62_6270 [Nonomuraea muscovyensis]|nr:hypothetical protein [Nonomuraea muscovyensis]